MRIVSALLLTALLTMSAEAQSLVEDFTGLTVGANLAGQSGWTKGGSGPDLTVGNTTPLIYNSYMDGGGNYAVIPTPTSTSSRVYKTFASPVTDYAHKTFYFSFLLRLTSTSATATGYFMSLGNAGTGTSYAAKLFAKTNGTGLFNIGISKTSNTAVFGSTALSLNTTYLIVVRYTFNDTGSVAPAKTDDDTYLWVNPSMPSEPSLSSAECTDTSSIEPDFDGYGTLAGGVGNFVWHNRGTANPAGAFDGIRVAYGATSADAWTLLTPIVPSTKLSTANINFGNVNVGSVKTDTITVRNTGYASLNITSVNSSKTNFTVTPNNGTVSAGDSLKIAVTYSPTAVGSDIGSIAFVSNSASSPDTVVVSGSGIQAGLLASTTSISFGNVIVNQSKDDSLYVKNTGTISLNISSVTSDNTIFTVTPTTAAVGANDSSWFHVSYAPTSVGTKSANIVFTSDAPTSPDTVKVSGTCIPIPPPGISSVTRSARVPLAGDSVIVSAKISDVSGITAVRLIYYVNDHPDSVAMTLSDTVYTGKIPGSVNQNGTRVEYCIHAISSSGLDSLTAKTASAGYFAGISSISLSGLKKEDPNLLNLYKGYYVKVTGVINGPNYQAANLSQYIQDSFGGLNLYKSGASANVFNLGDSLVVLGKLDQYRGTTEITPDTVTKDVQVIASGKKVTPIDLTIAQFNANPELYESRLVRFNEVYKKYATPVWATNTSLVMYEGTQADTVIMYVNSGVDAGAADEPVYPVKITAIAVQFTNPGTATTGPYEIQPRYQTDFVTVPAAPAIATPVDKATGVPRRTTFTWNRVVNATMYRLQVSTSNTFATTVFDTTLADTAKKLSTPLAASRTYYWRVSAADTVNSSNYSAFASFMTGTGIDAVDGNEGIPKVFALYQNYPNPFNPSTLIRYDLPKNAYVKVVIYDILGRVVANLVDGVETASQHSVQWNPGSLSSGIYFCRIQARSQDGTGNFTSVKKLLFMK